ncbi:MAG TPA: YfcE family phosphodiesterase [Candidatus Limiplasma sp.]|nr:YfcE family phosphodiesterase [Candidatus Limiplasma sp.]HPS81999.1 YfcE family phosphodiesterase [Candidatus Limiplasma sp.]
MKIVAFSDSHGNRGMLCDAVEMAMRGAPIDICVHCGDGARDMDYVEPMLREKSPEVRIYKVRGNWDVGAFDLPVMELFEANGVRMVAAHGHTFQVKSEYSSYLSAAEAKGAKVAFFGHTHHPLLEMVYGVYLINPGAICQRLAGNVAYAQVLVDKDGKIRADLMKWLF